MRFALFVLLAASSGLGQELSDSTISKVKARLAEGAEKSWELGTRIQTLLELDTPSFSVFSDKSLPPSQNAPDSLDTVFDIVKNITSTRPKGSGPQPLMVDGSAADPASNGVGVLIANWTRQPGEDYASSAEDQLNYLYTKVPRSKTGAISHRNDQMQLWSDFVYMVPPFLAYYGVTTSNKTLVKEAYTQIKLYRDALHDGHAHGLWRHVVQGTSGNDPGYWSTGNGWAAAGMLRVAATITRSKFKNDLKNEYKDLLSWTNEIHGGMYRHQRSQDALFTNYADDSKSFVDAAGAALLAASVYRLALLSGGSKSHIHNAEKTRMSISNSSSGHIDSDGWLTPVVNPHQYGIEGQKSAEGQAFVLQMHAAYEDWKSAGSPGANNGGGRALNKGNLVAGTILTVVSAGFLSLI